MTVGAEQSDVQGGTVDRAKVGCDGGKMELAMQLIFTPFVWRMMERKKKA